jgi:hypothetical protein
MKGECELFRHKPTSGQPATAALFYLRSFRKDESSVGDVLMGVLENQLFAEIDNLPASKSWFVQFAARNGVTTSDTRMAQSKSGKDYDGPMIVALLNQAARLKKFRDAMSPLPIRFDDPDAVAALINDFEAGKLHVTVSRSEEIELIFKVYGIEFSDQTLFRGIINSEIQKTTNPLEAAPIHDERLAKIAADFLQKMGHRCRVIDSRRRIADSKLIKNLADLGFTPEPAGFTGN